MLECNLARYVWALQGEVLLDFISQSQQEDSCGWLHEAVVILRHEEFVRLIVSLWAIWYARRKAIHDDIFQSPLSRHSFIERFILDLEIVISSKKSKKREGDARTQAPRWIPPPHRVIKLNVDAALSKNSNTSAMAAVARDETGVFLGASVLVAQGVSPPEVAEAMACREGLALASDLGLQRVRIATDCMNAVKSIYGLNGSV